MATPLIYTHTREDIVQFSLVQLRRPWTARIVRDCADNAAEVGRPGASDTVKSQCSNFELYPLRHWQPMEDVAKNRCDVLILTKTDIIVAYNGLNDARK